VHAHPRIAGDKPEWVARTVSGYRRRGGEVGEHGHLVSEPHGRGHVGNHIHGYRALLVEHAHIHLTHRVVERDAQIDAARIRVSQQWRKFTEPLSLAGLTAAMRAGMQAAVWPGQAIVELAMRSRARILALLRFTASGRGDTLKHTVDVLARQTLTPELVDRVEEHAVGHRFVKHCRSSGTTMARSFIHACTRAARTR